mgnify:CR=1 FL=1
MKTARAIQHLNGDQVQQSLAEIVRVCARRSSDIAAQISSRSRWLHWLSKQMRCSAIGVQPVQCPCAPEIGRAIRSINRPMASAGVMGTMLMACERIVCGLTCGKAATRYFGERDW